MSTPYFETPPPPRAGGGDTARPAEPAMFTEHERPAPARPAAPRLAETARVDEELEQTFPASDSPSWTLGRSRGPS